MSGEEAAIRVDGVSGATKNHSPLVSYGTLALPDAKLLFSAFAAAYVAVLGLSARLPHLDCHLQGLAQRNASAGLASLGSC